MNITLFDFNTCKHYAFMNVIEARAKQEEVQKIILNFLRLLPMGVVHLQVKSLIG